MNPIPVSQLITTRQASAYERPGDRLATLLQERFPTRELPIGTYARLAEELGLSTRSIAGTANLLGYWCTPPTRPIYSYECADCAKPFCSTRCHERALRRSTRLFSYSCSTCGREIVRARASAFLNVYCSDACQPHNPPGFAVRALR